MPGPVAVEDDLTVRCTDHGVVSSGLTSSVEADIAAVEHLEEKHPEITGD